MFNERVLYTQPVPSGDSGGTRSEEHPSFQRTISALCSDGAHWPTFQSQFYIGLLPPIERTLNREKLSHLSGLQRHNLLVKISLVLHTGMIRLAGRIWAKARSFSFKISHPSRPRSVLSLPSHLNHIKPSSSELNSFDIVHA